MHHWKLVAQEGGGAYLGQQASGDAVCRNNRSRNLVPLKSNGTRAPVLRFASIAIWNCGDTTHYLKSLEVHGPYYVYFP